MSENIPESIPTSADPKSRRPTKKSRGPNTAVSAQSAALSALFDKQGLDKEIVIPASATRNPRTAASLAPPPEIVANVQGSSAGAGSGEFHVYKAARRREYERIRLMEEESKREDADKAWKERMEENRKKDETKTSKNAKRREKAKARKAKVAKEGGGSVDSGADDGPDAKAESDKNKVTAGRPVDLNGHDREENAHDGAEAAEAEEQNGIVIHDED